MTSLRATETAFIVRVQATRAARALVPVAKALSFFGEHAAGWVLVGVAGALIDSARAWAWLGSILAVLVAHAISVVVKRIVRRARPGAAQLAGGGFDTARGSYTVTGPLRTDARVGAVGAPSVGGAVGDGATSASASGVVVYASAPSKLSFPSSHASSTMAAMVVYTAFVPWLWPVAVLVALLMGVSRVILGMHFPTDVLAGYAIGLLVGVATVVLLH